MFDWNKKGLIEEVKELIAKVENDKWITIHPNGEDNKGRPLLLKDGESPKEAIERTYGNKEEKVKKDDKKVAEYKKQLHDKYKSLKTPEEKQAYIKYADEETKKYDKDVNYKEAVEWLKEVDKSDIFGKQSDKGEEQVNLEGKSKDINKLVNFIKGKTGINLSEYKGYAEDKGWSKRNQLYIDYDKLKKDWFRKDNAKYEDTLYWLGLYSDTEDNGGFGKFVTPKKDKKIDNSLTNTIANALTEVISENCF